MKPNVIPPTPQGHFVPQLYHKAARGVSSLKTSSLFEAIGELQDSENAQRNIKIAWNRSTNKLCLFFVEHRY